jgi:hypothetical protein
LVGNGLQVKDGVLQGQLDDAVFRLFRKFVGMRDGNGKPEDQLFNAVLLKRPLVFVELTTGNIVNSAGP